MPDKEIKTFLNPITLEANFFLKALEKYGPQYQILDKELLCTLDKLVDAINTFYDNAVRLEETDELKLIKVKEAECLVRSYNCPRCQKFLGSNVEKAVRHIQAVHCPQTRRKKRTTETSTDGGGGNEQIKLPKKARTLLSGKLSRTLRTYFHAGDKLKKIPDYGIIENDLVSSIQELYPDKSVKAYMFGSRISGVGHYESDLDIYVDIDGSFHEYNYRAPTHILDINKRVSSALKKDKKWSHVLPINNARVPIIKLKHVSTKIDCDIGFSNSLGFCNTLLMQYFFELQPIAARICIVIKEWLERTGLNESVATYSFTLMVIFYLQTKHILPTVENLQKDLDKPEFIGPWTCNFKKKSLKELNLGIVNATKSTLREHIYNFFVFYAVFDYDKMAICPYKGLPIEFSQLMNILPERFKIAADSKECKVDWQLQRPMVVLDPLELSHNVTKGISKALRKIIVSYFIDSAQILNFCETSSKAATANHATTENKNTDADSSDGGE